MPAGRDAERAEIAAVVDAARHGRGGALVVRGVAGSGKSTLLADAIGSAAGMRVLRTQGVESESPLAFAALQRLLWPLREGLDLLAPPQRAALRAALGEAEGEGARFLVFLGTLSLLADAAEVEPVLAVVDDAHWLDDASTAALLFVARRLHAERVALLLAARDGESPGLDAPDLPTVVLGGLTAEAAGLLLTERAGEAVDPGVRDRLVTATGGNPLALAELADVLTADQLAARLPLPAQLPMSEGVERAFLHRCRGLSDAAQRFLLVAAADDTSRLTVVGDAAERLGIGVDAVDEVERAGLVRVEGTELSLHHPLVRSAVYRAATSAQRRATHRALAEALGADPDRAAWHRAAAADRPDERTVAELAAVAERAAGRGGHEAAASAWARAAELADDTRTRARLLHSAAAAAWSSAQPGQAAALANVAVAQVSDQLLRAQLLALQAQIAWNTRSLDDGYDLVLQAAEAAAPVDRALSLQLAVVASALAVYGARTSRAVDPADFLLEPLAGPPAQNRTAAALLLGFAAAARRDWAAAADAFREAFASTEEGTTGDHLERNLGIAALVIGDDERGLRLHEQMLTAARRAGALDLVHHALTRGTQFHIAVGAWDRATNAATEAASLAASTGNPALTTLPTAQLAVLAAQRGDEAADRHLAEAAALRQANPVGVTDRVVVDLLRWARALRSAGQPAIALQHLEQIGDPGVERLAAVDRLETAVRAGRSDLARSWLADLEDFAAGTRAAAAVAVVEHGRALLAEGRAAEDHFRAALAAHADSPRVPDRARTELALGEHLRRARRRLDAREHLRAALALFDELGAADHVERATAELRASGETARRRDVSTTTDLTPQERHVAALVRQGLPTREVAAQLFLSPRTVDFHLRNIFGKLGVTSRAELAALPLAD